MENWCLGMGQEDIVAGIDFDSTLFGYEEAPLRLLSSLIEEVEANDVKLTFNSFSSLGDIKEYIKELEQE